MMEKVQTSGSGGAGLGADDARFSDSAAVNVSTSTRAREVRDMGFLPQGLDAGLHSEGTSDEMPAGNRHDDASSAARSTEWATTLTANARGLTALFAVSP